jgi:hypothetical protein
MRSFALAALLLLSSFAVAQQIEGDYIETRSADIYTGQCVANGEVNLTGSEAILAWRIRRGSWNDVDLSGLSVAGIVKANATLGDPHGQPYPAKSVLVLDRQATDVQRRALISFAESMGGRLFETVVKTVVAPIQFEVRPGRGHHHFFALMKAGDVATVQTRPLNDKDHLCGNEMTFYPPLTKTAHAMPAVAVADEYTGNSLGITWSTSGRRSAFVGTFSR